MAYCVDTSTWIDAVRDYNPASPLFADFWDFVEAQILAGEIIAPEEVYVELKQKTLKDSREFTTFIRSVSGTLFIKPDDEIQARFSVIVGAYPELVTKNKPLAKSNCDAWVIALAQERDAVVVTHEVGKPAALKPYKIPDVCRVESVRCIRLPVLLNELQDL
jgi:hypothetical protein